MARARTIASAGVLCYVNGVRFGRVTGFRFNSATPRQAKYGIDSSEPFELMITITKVTISLKMVRTVADGGAEGAGLTTTYADLPREKYCSIVLVERGSDTIIFQADHCAVTDQSWNADAKGIVTGSVELEALDWSNEIRPN